MPRARRKSVSATPRTLSEETKTALKTYLKQFVEGLIQETVRRRYNRDTEEALPSGRGTIKPFHEAILPSRVRAVSEFERSFSTRLGSTFEACAQIIAAQYHKHAQRGYKLQASVSRRALEEVNMQIRAFESMATQAQRLRFDDMVAAVLSKASNDDTVELSITADLYILRHDGTELFFEIKSPQPNKGQCLEVTQRLLRIHLARQKPRPQVQAYFAMPYNPYGNLRSDYQWGHAKNYTPFEDAVRIGEEFWSMVGTDSTYQELLQIYAEVGQECERAILQLFR
jgi:hypothetical protein